MAPSFLIFILLQISTVFGKTVSKFPAILIFGDSTVDTGNNNYIKTFFRGNHNPYGHDFDGGVATGRFSNGKLVPDFLASMLGLKETVPPFLDPRLSDNELETGVSFASGGSGYDDLTSLLSGVIPMSKQPDYFKKYAERLETVVGAKKAQEIINGALIIVSAGTNDFIFNFYDVPTREAEFNITGYQSFLQNRLRNFVKELYVLGGRKIVIAGLPPTGCLPIQMTITSKSPLLRNCIGEQNLDAQSYNNKLSDMLPELHASFPGTKFIYADIYNPLIDMIKHPNKYGFVETRKGCCGTGLLEAGPLCTPLSLVCANPSEYIFWDSIHPSETTYRYLSKLLMKKLVPE